MCCHNLFTSLVQCHSNRGTRVSTRSDRKEVKLIGRFQQNRWNIIKSCLLSCPFVFGFPMVAHLVHFQWRVNEVSIGCWPPPPRSSRSVAFLVFAVQVSKVHDATVTWVSRYLNLYKLSFTVKNTPSWELSLDHIYTTSTVSILLLHLLNLFSYYYI